MAGLDCLWSLPGGQEPRFDPPLSVVYPDGLSSGRVYAAVVKTVTDQSLFEDKLDTRELQAIAIALNGFSPDPAFLAAHNLTPQEYYDLQRLFETYARLGATLTVLW